MKVDATLILNAITTLCFFLGVFIINGFKNSVDKMQLSLSNLNINIATLIEKDINKDKRLDEHKADQTKIELMVYGLETKTELIEQQVFDLKKSIDQILFHRD